MTCQDCGYSNEYFSESCKYYLTIVKLDGTLNMMKEKIHIKGYKGVNIIYAKTDEIGNTFTPHFHMLPKDRYYVKFDDITTVASGVDTSCPFFDQVKKDIEGHDMEKETAFLFLGECGHYIFMTIKY